MHQRQQFLSCSPRSRWVGIRWSLALALLACATAISYGAQVAAAAGTITAATNTSPIVITSAAHGLLTDDQVIVSGVMGNTAANGSWTVTLVDADRFSLNGSTGNGAYTGGGTFTTDLPQPPTALADSYSTNEDTPLNVAAPGVLGNDTDAENDALTAVLVSGPSNGTLTLNADGSFTYMPAADFSGSDSFTYKANDGQADSNVATVTITVVSAASQISQLKAQVQALITSGALPRSNGQALINKLDSAQTQLQKGNSNAAITKLQEFITQVNDYIANGLLTAAAGQPLIDAANAIITSLSGGASTATVDAVALTAADQPNRIFLPVVTR